MVLFKKDTTKYPNMIYDWDTTNKTFIEIVGILERLGVENRFFPLTLLNKDLKGIDPFDPNLDNTTKLLIAKEVQSNFWYFIREVVRISPIGSATTIRFRANRYNISLYWLFFNHITVFGTIIRQSGKTYSTATLIAWLITIGGYNIRCNLLTKSRKLRDDTVLLVKSVMDELPPYLDMRVKDDKNNSTEVSVIKLQNLFSTSIANASPKVADALGRGHTYNIQFIDELAFCSNIHITLPALITASNAAVENAKRVNGLYGFIYTTTAGFLSSKEGAFGYKLRNESLPWSEKLFDSEDLDDLRETIEKNNLTRLQAKDENVKYVPVRVLLEYNHRQLGYTDAWLREKIIEANITGDQLKADYFNIWGKGSASSPISPDNLERIYKSGMDVDVYTEVSKDRYITRWYIDPDEIDDGIPNRHLILAIDPSEAIGKDDIGLVILDSNNGEVVACGNYSETNLYIFTNFLFTFFTRFEHIVMVPERRSSGTAILDILINIFLNNGYDPLKYIFNWVVNDQDVSVKNKELLKERYKDIYFYNSIKKEFGYATAGSGRASRDNLYGTSFNNAIKYVAHGVKDKVLITQLSELVIRNDRIDHQEDGKDDLVICWLLCVWFLTNAKNKDYYGIPHNRVLQRVKAIINLSKEDVVKIREKQKQQAIKNNIENLKELIQKENNPFRLKTLIGKYNFLVKELVDEDYEITSVEDLTKNKKMYSLIRR